jgi:hypothetical protein
MLREIEMAFNFFDSIPGRVVGWVLGVSPEFHNKDAKALIADAIRAGERFTDEGWTKYLAAARIAVNAGVLRECREDPGHYFNGNEGVENAYKLGNAEFTAGKLGGTFESRQEMMDVIKFVIYDNSRAECEICASARPCRWG